VWLSMYGAVYAQPVCGQMYQVACVCLVACMWSNVSGCMRLFGGMYVVK